VGPLEGISFTAEMGGEEAVHKGITRRYRHLMTLCLCGEGRFPKESTSSAANYLCPPARTDSRQSHENDIRYT